MVSSIGSPGPLPYRRGEGPGGSLSHDTRLLPNGAKAKGIRVRRVKLRKAKAEALKRGLVARSCARSGRKDVVGEVKGIEMMGVLIAGRGARERGDRRLEVKVDSKR